MLIPLTYIELSRPRDLLKAGLNLVLGMLLLLKKNDFDNLYSSILVVLTILLIFYLVEICSIRWNQLTDKEKNKLKTIVELKKNVSKLIEAVSLAINDVFNLSSFSKFGINNENLNKKKWVRNGENDNIITSYKNNFLTSEMPKKATIQSKKDTINEEKK